MRFTLETTIADLYRPAMEITDPQEALDYFERLVTEVGIRAAGQSREEAESIQRQNLGYYAGYYDSETRARVERLFSCSHPVFGAIAENGQPTPEGASAAGMSLAKDRGEVR